MANRKFKRTKYYPIKITLRRMIRNKQVTYEEAKWVFHHWVKLATEDPAIVDPFDPELDFEGMIVDIMAAEDRAKEGLALFEKFQEEEAK